MQEYKKDLGKVVMTPAGKWDIAKSYDLLCLVYEDITERSYISKQYVPTGVDLQDSRYWMPLNVSGYSDSNIIILNQKDENGNIKSYSLEEAINKIAEVGRKPGAIIGFYHKDENRLDIGGRWEIWQFDDNNIYNWNNLSHWTNIYYNYNKFVGWFRDENVLNVEYPKPEIGCYAFVGSIYNEAIIYRCDIKGKWTKINELAQHYIKVIVGGNISIGDNGNWYQDGKDTGVPASIKGDNGKTPYIRNNNNILEYSYNEIDWFPISDKVAAWFRWKNNKIQISRDKVIWDDLSDQFQVNIYIKGYVASSDLLPSGQPIGTVYGVGPTYISEDDPIYRIYVYTSNGWIDNGIFKGISAGVVQERGTSTTEVMSQDAVSKELTKLESVKVNRATGLHNATLSMDFDTTNGTVEISFVRESTKNSGYIYNERGFIEIKEDISVVLNYSTAGSMRYLYATNAGIYITNSIKNVPYDAVLLEVFYVSGNSIIKFAWTSFFIAKTGVTTNKLTYGFAKNLENEVSENKESIVEINKTISTIITEKVNPTYDSVNGIWTETGEVLRNYRIAVDWAKAGTKVRVVLKEQSGSSHNFNVAFYRADGTYKAFTKQLSEIGKVYVYELTEDYTEFHIYDAINAGNFIAGYSVNNLRMEMEESNELIENLQKHLFLKNSTLSILGDSYSTYGKWAYSAWYAMGGIDGNNYQDNDVSSVKETWWYQLCNSLGINLLINDSYSGSPICNTGYDGADATNFSFVTRMDRAMGESRVKEIKPNIIILFGGTNDSSANSPLGALKYSNWTDEDLKNVLPAICYMMHYIKYWNPGAIVINVVNPRIKDEIKEAFVTASNYYNIKNIELNLINSDYSNGHPNISGMTKIAKQLEEFILNL